MGKDIKWFPGGLENLTLNLNKQELVLDKVCKVRVFNKVTYLKLHWCTEEEVAVAQLNGDYVDATT